jgi:broad-specificity NMP kinase
MTATTIPSVAGRRRLVELVGPAGAGKTTVARLLRQDAGVRAAPGLWSLPRGPLGLNALRLLPRVLGFYRAFPGQVWAEMKQIVRLDTLYQVVGARNGAAGPVLLDEGPVLALGWLTVFGDDRVRRPAFAAWREAAVARWAAALDVVVLLDAPDPVLVRRIRERTKPHDVKSRSDGAIVEFTKTYRTALEAAVAALSRPGGLAVVRIDTGDDAPETTAARVRAALLRVTDGD